MQFQKKKKKECWVFGPLPVLLHLLEEFCKRIQQATLCGLLLFWFIRETENYEEPSCILHKKVLMLLVHILDLTFYNSLLNYYTSLLTTDTVWFCQHPVWGCQVCQIREFFVILFCSFLNSRNRSERLSGRQTNNRAEIHVRAKPLVLCWLSLKYLYKCVSLLLLCCHECVCYCVC